MRESNQSDRQGTANRSGAANAPAASNYVTAQVPTLTLPKGGGAIRGIGEKFAANPVTGTGSMSVPIAISPGRGGFGPQLSLSYDSGSGNGPFGFGWSLNLPQITRKTDKGLPQYNDAEDADIYILTGAEDLVPVLNEDGTRFTDHATAPGHVIHRYRPRIDGLFARIERWTNIATGEIHWRSITRDNITTLYGTDNKSRIFGPDDLDKAHPRRIFGWLICQSYDDKGNAIIYEYQNEDSQRIFENQQGQFVALVHERNRSDATRSVNRYVKRIKYGNRVPNRDTTTWQATDPAQLPNDTWMFEVVFDYGEGIYAEDAPDAQGRVLAQAQIDPPSGSHWPVRQDPFSTYRAGFEVRTYRLCHRVLMFHHFPQELGIDDCLVSSTELSYSESPIASFISSVTQSGYVRQPIQNQPNRYLKQSLPLLEFEYSQVPSPAELAQQPIREVDSESLENLPVGLGDASYLWMDLDGEGISGILTEQADGWYYKRNLSANNQVRENGHQRTVAHFGPMELVASKPAVGLAGGAQFLDLAGDGQVDLVQMEGALRGFYERTEDASWAPFQPFVSWPDLNIRDPDLKFVDLTGDGHADILITEGEALTWCPSLAEEGFGPAIRLSLPLDEEKGPRLVFSDGLQSIYLADLSGDGLSDLVRIRNAEICYWPNLGYGHFGTKVTMDHAPWFDSPDQFDQRRIRLADIDGSGTTDLLYLRRDGVHIYFNQSGNRWSDAVALLQFPPIDNISSVQVLDLLGNGTACLVWSSSLPSAAHQPMRYLALIEEKPHLLVGVQNNLGAETRLQYAPSTKFYLRDKHAGKPWITRLPFPVHVVERIETYDQISRNRFVTRYAYHHGYFDGEEREFRGFGMVEQRDTEDVVALTDDSTLPEATNIDAASHVPPVLTRTWFHTGVYLGHNHVSDFFAGLLDVNDKGEYYREPGLTDEQARQLLLEDTEIPAELTLEEERQACRALKGSMLRQEVYALDGTDEEEHPYTITEQNFTIERLQPQGANQHAVFFTHAREVIIYHYERNPQDPRVGHSITLEVDKYGNVLKSVAIGYGRRQSPLAEQQDRDKQTQTLITYTDNHVTTAVDDARHPHDYRAPLACETRTYELTGYAPTGAAERFKSSDFVKPDPDDPQGRKLIQIFDDELNYQEQPSIGRQRRLVEHVQTLYRKNDFSGLLRLSELESLALPGESYKLAFTPGLLAQIYKRKLGNAREESLLPEPRQVLEGTDTDRGGYVELDGDGHWWIPSGRVFYSPSVDAAADELTFARKHFFLPHRFRDPFGQSSLVAYDSDDANPQKNHNLLLVKTEDALGNTVTAVNDYRMLQPGQMTDPNGNRTQVAFDALGMVVGTAVMGKNGEGDSFTTFTADLTPRQIKDYFDAANPRSLAISHLGTATIRIIYDLDRVPACASSIARETHIADLAQDEQTGVQLSFVYSDGFGREAQTKIQAEPGPLDPDDPASPMLDPRWVGRGAKVYNNKGAPVRQYEPFFSPTHHFGIEQHGVSSTLFYDPVGRVAATLHPNHTYEKVVFDPWQQTTYDVNDTVTFDPRTDPDVGGFFTRLPDTDYLPTWRQQRIGGTMGAPEQRAAQKASAHADTPSTAHLDTLGRTFLTFADNGPDPAQPGTHLLFATRVELDIEGNQRAIRDAVVQNGDAQGRIVMRYDYDMLGNRIHQASMDAGERWMLNDATGKPIRAWDSRGFVRRIAYDELRRLTGLFVTENGVERLVERTVYGERHPETSANLRGRVFRIYDGAGVATSASYDFKGNLLISNRRLARGYDTTVDWSPLGELEALSRLPAAAEPLLEPAPPFIQRTTYDALNRSTTLIIPDKSVYRPIYNQAGLLDKVDVSLRGAGTATPFVRNIDYNAKGQRTQIDYHIVADGVPGVVRTRYTYERETFRLLRLLTTRSTDNAMLQDLRYTYDPAGNITSIRDDAQQTTYFRNRSVEPSAEYTYDAIYRLIEATGREHLGQAGGAPIPHSHDDASRTGLPHPGDGGAMGTYAELYQYDSVGNILSMIHRANSGNWTQRYQYSMVSNRLLGTSVPSDSDGTFSARYQYDAHGNLIKMPHLALMEWDYKDQLRATQRQVVNDGVGERTYYVYDAAGQRVRKVTERRKGTRKEERIYLGGFEVYRRYNGDGQAVTLERETLHVMDDKQRIALVETRTLDTVGNDRAPQQLVRYQLGNHLGSAILELDDQAQIISYEEYTPYGSTSYQAVRSRTETPKRYRYTGKERDEETGLYYHGARYYAPWLGRWTSCDPKLLSDSLSAYVYCRNNPVRYVDKSGLESDEEIVKRELKTVFKERGIAFSEEVEFYLLDANGQRTVKGRSDFVWLDQRSGQLKMLEAKGGPNSPKTIAQETYVPAMQKGATIEISGWKGGTMGVSPGVKVQTGNGGFALVERGTLSAFKQGLSGIGQVRGFRFTTVSADGKWDVRFFETSEELVKFQQERLQSQAAPGSLQSGSTQSKSTPPTSKPPGGGTPEPHVPPSEGRPAPTNVMPPAPPRASWDTKLMTGLGAFGMLMTLVGAIGEARALREGKELNAGGRWGYGLGGKIIKNYWDLHDGDSIQAISGPDGSGLYEKKGDKVYKDGKLVFNGGA